MPSRLAQRAERTTRAASIGNAVSLLPCRVVSAGIGFGIRTHEKRRKDQYTSLWDMISPGRQFVKDLGLLPSPKLSGDILKVIEAYLAMSQEEKLGSHSKTPAILKASKSQQQ
jgi:hypothetical protein